MLFLQFYLTMHNILFKEGDFSHYVNIGNISSKNQTGTHNTQKKISNQLLKYVEIFFCVEK